MGRRDERILVFEAKEQLRVLCSEVLSSAGYRVSSFASAPQARAALRGLPFHLAILDLDCQEGLELLAHVQHHYPAVAVIGVSSSKSSGVNQCLARPYNVKALKKSVAAALRVGGGKGTYWSQLLSRRRREKARRLAFSEFVLGVQSHAFDKDVALVFWKRLCQLERAQTSSQGDYAYLQRAISVHGEEAFPGLPSPGMSMSFSALHAMVSAGQLEIRQLEELAASGRVSALSARSSRWTFGGPSVRAISHLLDQLAILLESGFQVLESLVVVQDPELHPRLLEMLEQVEMRVSQGSTLSRALADFPDVIPDSVLVLIRTGEKTGGLVASIRRSANLMKRKGDLYGQLLSALAGPAFTLLFGAGVLWAIVRFVMPRFIEVYSQMDLELPALSKLVISIVGFVNQPQFVACFVLTMSLLWLYRNQLKQTLGYWAVNAPLIRNWTGMILTKELCDVLATLQSSGLPLQEAFATVSRSTDLEFHRTYLRSAEETLKEEGSLEAALRRIPYLTPLALSVCQVAEESGALETLFRSLDDLLEQELTHTLGQFLVLLEPMILFVLGGTIAVFFTGLFLPVYGLVSAI